MKRLTTIGFFVVLAYAGIFAQNDVQDVIIQIQKKYAPDKRTAIFSVIAIPEKASIVLRGEVNNSDAKNELFKLLETKKNTYIDSIVVLPQSQLGEQSYGIITVSVANMRSEPTESAELVSQVLMGNIVRLWKMKNGYYLAQSPDMYLGWIESGQLQRVDSKDANTWMNSKKIFVKKYYEFVRQHTDAESFPVCDVTGGAVLKKFETNGDWVKVGLADGRSGFLPINSVINFEDWGKSLTPIADNIERTGKYLLGVPYLWGGTSTKGVDCSGFTKTVYLLNGQQLSRDANQQAEEGKSVEAGVNFENLKKGDLLFFGRKAENGKTEHIAHVGLYLGNKDYIHSSGKVRINSFDPNSPIFDEPNLKRFVRARRMINSSTEIKEDRTKK
jgi:gamma-D-glutamyl-L-lysine dipeptidyl-peptidase